MERTVHGGADMACPASQHLVWASTIDGSCHAGSLHQMSVVQRETPWLPPGNRGLDVGKRPTSPFRGASMLAASAPRRPHLASKPRTAARNGPLCLVLGSRYPSDLCFCGSQWPLARALVRLRSAYIVSTCMALSSFNVIPPPSWNQICCTSGSGAAGTH